MMTTSSLQVSRTSCAFSDHCFGEADEQVRPGATVLGLRCSRCDSCGVHRDLCVWSWGTTATPENSEHCFKRQPSGTLISSAAAAWAGKLLARRR